MSSIRLAAAATAALLLTAPMAQASPYHFAGFYAVVHFGYSDVDAEFKGSSASIGDEGLMGGLQAGYNVLVNNSIIWGVETDISGIAARPSGTCSFNGLLDCEINLGPTATLRGRLGFATGNWLVYVTGGVAATHYEVDSQTKVRGATIDDANGGVFGSLLSTPILNIPQSGILGMHKIQPRPMAMPDGSVEVRPMMYLALSYDHRIVDGREAVSFLVRLKECIEDPQRIMLDT